MPARRRLTVKRLDPWSVLKFGFLANLCLLAIGLLGALVVWFFVQRLDLVARACGIAENVGFDNCGVNGGNLFRALLLLGLLGVIIQTGVLVFLSFLHNLIADLVGGLEISVVDETASTVESRAQEIRTTTRSESGAGQPRLLEPPEARPRERAGDRTDSRIGTPPPPRGDEQRQRQGSDSMWSTSERGRPDEQSMFGGASSARSSGGEGESGGADR